MPLDQLVRAKKRTVGMKQTKKAIEKGSAQKVFIANDAEQHVTEPLIALCQEQGIEVVMVDNMKELGKACGIQVGAAAAAIAE